MPLVTRAARWIAPSLIAACGGAIAEGVFEALFDGKDLGGYAIAASIGFIALVVVPALFLAGLVVRGLWAAWALRALVRGLVEPSGGAPRLAGWIAVVWLAFAGVAWTGFQSTWMLESWTSFKPVVVSFGIPVFALAAALATLLLSRPAVAAIAFVARKLDVRWRRTPGRASLVTPTKILIGTAVATVALAVLTFLFARIRLGPLDVSLAYGPLVAIAAAFGVQALWRGLDRARWVAGAGLAIASGVAIAIAISATRSQPGVTLGIWGDEPIAGIAIDRLFDLDRIRASISLAQFKPNGTPGALHPDIVLVTIDTVRADHTPPYSGHAEMPGLRALGTRGMVFEWAFSPGNVTRRSIPSIAIGLQPNRIRGRVVGWALRVDPRHVMLAERLAAAGYDTAGFMCCDGFYGADARTGLQRGLQHLEIEKSGLALAKSAHVWLEERERGDRTKPLFLWMHILEPHGWIQVNGEPRTDEERTRYYDRSLAAADAALVELLAGFANRAPGRAPIVIVTADHGEGLGEHGQPYHSTDLYDSQIHVPLVFAGPGITPGRATETVSLVDLVPTIIELAGFQPPSGPSIDGRSIADLATGKRVGDPAAGVAFAAMIKDRSNPGGLATIVRGPYKVINNGPGYELYNVHADPDEKFNLITHLPGIVTELKKLLAERSGRAELSPF